jgi:Cu-processing system permease protein
MNPELASIDARCVAALSPSGAMSEEASSATGCRSAARHVAAIARREFSERLRSGWVIACIAVWLGAVGLTSFFGLVQVGRLGVQGYERTVISLLNLVQYLVPLLGLLVGHDLIVGEREERTLSLVLACGVSRTRLVLGKFLGGCATLTFPLALGFTIAGTAIGLVAKDRGIGPFLTLAFSGLLLGIVFLGAGLWISIFSRSRVQSLAVALLTWCAAVFAFDLVALGALISTKAPGAAQEIDVICDTTHVNAAADIHSAFDTVAETPASITTARRATSFNWLFVNPVDLFRAVNLSRQLSLDVPPLAVALTFGLWLTALLGASVWRFRRLDL